MHLILYGVPICILFGRLVKKSSVIQEMEIVDSILIVLLHGQLGLHLEIYVLNGNAGHRNSEAIPPDLYIGTSDDCPVNGLVKMPNGDCCGAAI